MAREALSAAGDAAAAVDFMTAGAFMFTQTVALYDAPSGALFAHGRAGQMVRSGPGRLVDAAGTWVELVSVEGAQRLWAVGPDGMAAGLPIDIMSVEASAMEGARVLVQWPGRAFEGTVMSVDASVNVHYDDGDRGAYTREELVARGVCVLSAPRWKPPAPGAAAAGGAPDARAVAALSKVLEGALSANNAIMEPASTGPHIWVSWTAIPVFRCAMKPPSAQGGADRGLVVRAEPDDGVSDAYDVCFRALLRCSPSSSSSSTTPAPVGIVNACAALCDGSQRARTCLARIGSMRLAPALFEIAAAGSAGARLFASVLDCADGRELEAATLREAGCAWAAEVLWGRIECSTQALVDVTSVPAAALCEDAFVLLGHDSAAQLLPAVAELLIARDSAHAATLLEVILSRVRQGSAATKDSVPVCAPPTSVVAVGQAVRAKYRGMSWYAGRISKCNGNSSYDIAYDDGDREIGVLPNLIRVVGAGGVERDLVMLLREATSKGSPVPQSKLPGIVAFYTIQIAFNTLRALGTGTGGADGGVVRTVRDVVRVISVSKSWRNYVEHAYVLCTVAWSQLQTKDITTARGTEELAAAASLCRQEVQLADSIGINATLINAWFRDKLSSLADDVIASMGWASLRDCEPWEVPASICTCIELCSDVGQSHAGNAWRAIVESVARACVHGLAVQVSCSPSLALEEVHGAVVSLLQLAGCRAAVVNSPSGVRVDCTDGFQCARVLECVTGETCVDDAHVLTALQPLVGQVSVVARNLYGKLEHFIAVGIAAFPYNGGLVEPAVFAAFGDMFKGLQQVVASEIAEFCALRLHLLLRAPDATIVDTWSHGDFTALSASAEFLSSESRERTRDIFATCDLIAALGCGHDCEISHVQFLASRMLSGRGDSLALEWSVLERLSAPVHGMGALFAVARAMLSELSTAGALQNRFRAVCGARTLRVLAPAVLSQAVWSPFVGVWPQMTLPAAMQLATRSFDAFYRTQFPSRTLQWVMDAGYAAVCTRDALRTVELEVSTLQAAVLISDLCNDFECWSLVQMSRYLHVGDSRAASAALSDALESLVSGGVLARCDGGGAASGPDTLFRVASVLGGGAAAISPLVIHRSRVVHHARDDAGNRFEWRHAVVDAAIMRTLKLGAGAPIGFRDLVRDVQERCAGLFRPTAADIAGRVSDLCLRRRFVRVSSESAASHSRSLAVIDFTCGAMAEASFVLEGFERPRVAPGSACTISGGSVRISRHAPLVRATSTTSEYHEDVFGVLPCPLVGACSLSQFMGLQELSCVAIAEVLGESVDVAYLLLDGCDYEPAWVIEDYVANPSAACARVGIPRASAGVGGAYAASLSHTCTVCYGDFAPADMFTAWCGHDACHSCWRSVIGIALEERDAVGCVERGGRCSCVLSRTDVRAIAGKAAVRRMCEQAAVKYLSKAPLMARCKGRDCEAVISWLSLDRRVVCRRCGDSFCAGCKFASHSPASCEDALRWFEQ